MAHKRNSRTLGQLPRDGPPAPLTWDSGGPSRRSLSTRSRHNGGAGRLVRASAENKNGRQKAAVLESDERDELVAGVDARSATHAGRDDADLLHAGTLSGVDDFDDVPVAQSLSTRDEHRLVLAGFVDGAQ